MKNTAKTIGEKLGLPISLSSKLNISKESPNVEDCIISKNLPEVFNFIKEEASLLKLLLLAVPLSQLKVFLKNKVKDSKKYESLLSSLDAATQEESISTAFMTGVELQKDKEDTWVFDI